MLKKLISIKKKLNGKCKDLKLIIDGNNIIKIIIKFVKCQDLYN